MWLCHIYYCMYFQHLFTCWPLTHDFKIYSHYPHLIMGTFKSIFHLNYVMQAWINNVKHFILTGIVTDQIIVE